jgi:hypothetical protein
VLEKLHEHYYVSPHIRHTWVGDRVVILDLHSESYFALDPTASHMWLQLTLQHTREKSLRDLKDRYSVDAIRVESDFDAFVKRCVTAGLLTDRQPSPPRSEGASARRGPARGLFSIRAWWSLFCATRGLSRLGFFRTYMAATQMGRPNGDRASRNEDLLSRAVKAFARAENFFYLKKAPRDCLPRSLALFRFLRSVGFPAEHCIGVRQFPFLAHAWTQCWGHVVHDDPSNQERFTIIARIAA